MQQLTATAVKQGKPKDKPYKLADGGSLYVHVKPTGKHWRYKYRFANNEKLLALICLGRWYIFDWVIR